MRKQFKLMKDTNNRTFFKDGLNRHQYYTDDEGDMHCIETFLNVYITMLNDKQHEIKELEKEKKQLEKLINERIKYLKENNLELLERDKYTEIYILKWVLSIMNGDLK